MGGSNQICENDIDFPQYLDQFGTYEMRRRFFEAGLTV